MKAKELNKSNCFCHLLNGNTSHPNLRRVITRHINKNQHVIPADDFYTSILTCFNTSILTPNYSYSSMKILSVILLIILFLTGCKNSDSENSTKYISASACAKELSNGEIVDCTPSESMQNQQTSFLHQLMKLDEENPGPKGPDILHLESTQLFSVKEISNNGIILLENGIKLKLAGIECRNEEAVKYLRAMFKNPDASKLAYLLTGYADGQYKYAYVWEIGFLNAPDIGPTLGSSNETLITSGWCNPIMQEKHLYYSRYKRLEEIGKEL